jgi:hypothetical protein
MVSEVSVYDWLLHYGPVVRQNIMVVKGVSKQSCLLYGSQEAERERQGEAGDKVYLSRAFPQ